MKKTNYVIVVDFEEDNNLLEDQYLLGWNNMYDYWDTETVGDDLIKNDGTIKENEFGLIDIDRWTTIYCNTELTVDFKDTCEGGREDDIDCTICRLEQNNDGEWIVIPV